VRYGKETLETTAVAIPLVVTLSIFPAAMLGKEVAIVYSAAHTWTSAAAKPGAAATAVLKV
jgi:hypothetical protein